MHCLVEFILDSLFGIISCNMILQPRKDIKDYREGDIVEAMYMGKRHPVKIIKLSEHKTELSELVYTVIGQYTDTSRQVVLADRKENLGMFGKVTNAENKRMEKKIQRLEEDLTKYQCVVKTLEERVTQLEGKSAPSALESESPSAEVSTTQIEDGVVGHEKAIAHISPDNIRDVVKILALRIFNVKELCTRSITGKGSSKGGDKPRESLDGHKVALLEKLVREKCPTIHHRDFMEKLQNVQKVLRRKQEKTVW